MERPEQPDNHLTGERIQTPRGSFALTDLSKEQMQAAGYGIHHESDDRKFLIMGNGTYAFAVRSEQATERDNPLKNAEMSLEDDYGMIDGIINNGSQEETKEKPSIHERLAETNGNAPSAPHPKRGVKGAPLPNTADYEHKQKMALGMVFLFS